MSIEQENTVQTARIPSFGAIVKEARPRQMVKNGLVLVPLFFTINIWYSGTDIAGMAAIIGRAFATLGIFVLLSAAIYFINDSIDVERDRAHPRKRHRPIAAGRMSIGWAIGIAGVFIVGGLAGALAFSIPMLVVGLAYLASNVIYSWWIKDIVLMDVMTVCSVSVFLAVSVSVGGAVSVI